MDNTAATEPLAFPGRKLGSVQLVNIKQCTRESSISPVLIDAHQNEIAALTLSNDATYLVTGSELVC